MRPEETFLEECVDLLGIMESSLLMLERDPSDEDAINAVFRAAHTIKGTSGVFGFDEVESFTHVVENVLERLRSQQLVLDDDLTAALLRCRDQIHVLVEAAVRDEALDDDTKALSEVLMQALQQYLGDETPSHSPALQTAEVEVLGDGRVVSTDNWHISLRFDSEVLRNGMDPLSFLRYLGRLGRIVHITTLYDNLPPLAQMDPEACYLGFEIAFESDANKESIEQVFEFVRDDCALHILPPCAHISRYAELISALPEDDFRIGELLVQCGALTPTELEEALHVQEALSNVAPETETRLGDVLVQQQVVHQEVVDAALDKQTRVKEKKSGGSQWLRVDAEKLDQLINLVGELVIAGASTGLLAHRLGDEALLESISMTSRLVEEIRDSALKLRMVQIGETFNRFQRVVRDVSKELGKEIELEINGADTELDKTVVEKIGDPLMHLVRNAMDHGIEPAQERVANDKSACGRLTLNAYHDSGSIVIEVKDDGRGLNREKILTKAIDKGLVNAGQTLTDQEIYRLIFAPGFSTADAITNLSGRGVGMDVVKKNIEALRGTVDVESIPGEGSTIVIRLPLTLAIIDGFLVGVGDSSYVIPLDMVLECIELTDKERQEANRQRYINLRGDVLPFLNLGEQFNEQNDSESRENIVVVQYGTAKAGIVVDALLGEFQTVIKPLGKVFQNIPGVSGATILGSGDVAVILDIPHLIEAATSAQMSGAVTVH